MRCLFDTLKTPSLPRGSEPFDSLSLAQGR
jgi:hypothetical protein